MSKDQDKAEPARKSVKIEDLPENTDTGNAEQQVKGGNRPRGRGLDSDPDSGEEVF